MYSVSIPEISKEELLSRYSRIKPIVEINKVKYFLRDFSEFELTGISYIWKLDEDKREAVDMTMYVPQIGRDFECIHKYGYYGFFKPSIAEVLAQIPELDINFIDAFEIIDSPKDGNDFAKNQMIFDNGYHVSTVRLYTRQDNPRVIFN